MNALFRINPNGKPKSGVKYPSWPLLVAFVVELDQACSIGICPAIGDVGVVLVGDVGVLYFHGRTFLVGVQFDGYDGRFFLFAEVPLLDDLLAGFELEVLANDTFIPHGKFGIGHGLHGRLVAGP